jgi:hypothetical protein
MNARARINGNKYADVYIPMHVQLHEKVYAHVRISRRISRSTILICIDDKLIEIMNNTSVDKNLVFVRRPLAIYLRSHFASTRQTISLVFGSGARNEVGKHVRKHDFCDGTTAGRR